MKKILIIILLLFGCSINQPVCRHYALYNASVVGEKYPVRIAMGWKNGNYHAQAQALINGEWEFIKDMVFGIAISTADPDFMVTEYLSLHEFFRKTF